MSPISRADLIKAKVEDIAVKFLYYDRKEDDILPIGSVEAAIAAGEVSSKDIIVWFADAIFEGLLENKQ